MVLSILKVKGPSAKRSVELVICKGGALIPPPEYLVSSPPLASPLVLTI